MTLNSRARVPRPRAVLSLAAILTIVGYLIGAFPFEVAALLLGFLAVLCLDSIAGSLDRIYRLESTVTPAAGSSEDLERAEWTRRRMEADAVPQRWASALDDRTHPSSDALQEPYATIAREAHANAERLRRH